MQLFKFLKTKIEKRLVVLPCYDQKSLKIPFLLSVDINPYACLATVETAKRNGVDDAVDVMCSSLLRNLRNNSIDVVLFNPVSSCGFDLCTIPHHLFYNSFYLLFFQPYVPSSPADVSMDAAGTIDAAWAGGVDGRQVIDAFVDSVADKLSAGGLIYLVSLWRGSECEF